jgi:hypothetical protein
MGNIVGRVADVCCTTQFEAFNASVKTLTETYVWAMARNHGQAQKVQTLTDTKPTVDLQEVMEARKKIEEHIKTTQFTTCTQN